MASSSRWRGMGAREAQSYASERKDFLKAASKGADWKPALRDASKVFGLELIGQVFKGIGKAGQKDLFNQVVANAGNRSYSLNQVLEKINPMKTYMANFEAQKDAIAKDGGEIGIRNPMDKTDYTAHFLTKAGLNEAKDMDVLRAILGGTDEKGVPKTTDMRLIDIQNYMAKADPRIQADAKRMIKKYEKDLGYFGNLKDKETGVLLTSANVQKRIDHIEGLLKVQLKQASLDGQLVSISQLDGWLYKLGITDGNVISNIINDVQNEDIGDGLKRRLSFNISDSVADEDFEIMVDTLLTGWNQIQKDLTPEQKEDLREASAILNKPEDNSKKDVVEAGKIIDETTDAAELAGNGFSYKDAAKHIGFKTDLVPLTDAQQKQRILDGLDALMEAEAVYLADQTPEGRITYRDATTKILKTVGRYRIKDAFAAGATDDLNNMKLRVAKVLATGTNYKDLDKGDKQLYEAFFTTGSKVTKPKNLPYSLGPTNELNAYKSGLNILEGLRYNSSGDSQQFVNERVNFLINKGWLSEANRQEKTSQLLDFIQSNPAAARSAGSVLEHMIKALNNDDPSIASFGGAYSSAINNYVLAGEQDLGDIKAKALTDVLTMSFTQSETGGLFGLKNFDKMYQVTGIANTKGIGKGSDWAILLGTDILYDKEITGVKNSQIIRSYTDLDEGQKLAIDTISRQFINWENGDGEFSSKYTGDPKNKKPSVNQITNMIDRYDYLYATAKELGKVSPDIAERLNPFIRTSEDMTNFGRQEFNAAYDYLRDSVYSELAFYNVALNKEATAVFDNVFSEGKYPSDTTKKELDIDTQMDELGIAYEEVKERQLEAREPDIISETEVDIPDVETEEEERNIWKTVGNAALWITTLGGPTALGLKWAGKKAAVAIPKKVAARITNIGTNSLKGKNLFNIKGKVDSIILQHKTVSMSTLAKKLPAYIKNTKDPVKRRQLASKWNTRQRKSIIKTIDPKQRLKILRDSKWYKGLAESEQAAVDVIVRSNSYKYGGKAIVDSQAVGKELLIRWYGKEAFKTGIKKYGPSAVGTGATITGASLLMKRAFEESPEEK